MDSNDPSLWETPQAPAPSTNRNFLQMLADTIMNFGRQEQVPNALSRVATTLGRGVNKLGAPTSEYSPPGSMLGDLDAAQWWRGSVMGTPEDLQRRNVQHWINTAMMATPTVYHGSPHLWPAEPGYPLGRFKPEAVGTGEGAAAFGHAPGGYWAESQGTGRAYKEGLEGANYAYIKGEPVKRDPPLTWAINAIHSGKDPKKYLQSMLDMNPGLKPELTEAIKRLPEAEKIPNTSYGPKPGNLYTGDLPDAAAAKMLDWDKPLSEQPKQVKVALSNKISTITRHRFPDGEWGYTKDGSSFIPIGNAKTFDAAVEKMTGREIYNMFGDASRIDKDKAASEYLASIGIPGIRYLDQGSRSAGKGTSNYVVFDPDLVKILSRE